MPTRLTLTGNSCNRGNSAGDHSMSGVRLGAVNVGTVRWMSSPLLRKTSPSQGKACMVNARLRESQTSRLEEGGRAPTVAALSDANATKLGSVAMTSTDFIGTMPPAVSLSPRRGNKGRTGHLTTPHLMNCVTTGSPKRAVLHRPAWRRSRHISQTPRVMPWTATTKWTDMAETDRATGWGTPAIRVKGGAFVNEAATSTKER